MSLREHLLSVKRGWKAVAVLVLLGAIAGAVMSAVVTPKYVSTTRFFVASAVESPDPEELFQRNQIAGQRVLSYVPLILSDRTTAAVLETLGDEIPGFNFADDVTATALQETVIIDVQVTGTSPQEAQRLAEAYAEAVPDVIADVESVGTREAAQVALSAINEPSLGEQKTPGPVRSVLFGALLGAVLGAGGVLLWGAVRREKDLASRE